MLPTVSLPALRQLSLVVALVVPLSAVPHSLFAQLADTPAPLHVVRAFPNLRLERPIVLTHPGDGTDRIVVASQLGKIHIFGNRSAVTEDDLEVFLDIESKVVYTKEENEEGLLGLAFHPRFKQNGEFFVYYTKKDAPEHTSVVSRFRATKPSSNQADSGYEEELLRIPQPFWNHNGGGLAFGPDGHLYVALGDGGKRDDPFGNGQNTETLLGSILRIDVDNKDPGLNYAIPKDNPFYNKPHARPEIFAYGFRNVWGMSFDSLTGSLWAADVGQDLWEEINIVTNGGNYGWNLREANHRFGKEGADPGPEFVEPVWEYHHDYGKSITGGVVYRGKKTPFLTGMYLYADYISGRVWALQYDEKKKQFLANYAIKSESMPYISFGVDIHNEPYITDSFGQIWTIAPSH